MNLCLAFKETIKMTVVVWSFCCYAKTLTRSTLGRKRFGLQPMRETEAETEAETTGYSAAYWPASPCQTPLLPLPPPSRFTHVSVLSACMSVPHACLVLMEDSIIGFPGTGVTVLQATMWLLGLNSCPLEEQPVFLTTELSL